MFETCLPSEELQISSFFALQLIVPAEDKTRVPLSAGHEIEIIVGLRLGWSLLHVFCGDVFGKWK